MIDRRVEQALHEAGRLGLVSFRDAYAEAVRRLAHSSAFEKVPTAAEVVRVLAERGIESTPDAVRQWAYALGCHVADGLVDAQRRIRLVPPPLDWK